MLTATVEQEAHGAKRKLSASSIFPYAIITRGEINMKKITIGEEEILIGECSAQQLTDDELERACGGDGGNDVRPKGLVCDQCNFWCSPPHGSIQRNYIDEYHRDMGCTGTLRYED